MVVDAVQGNENNAVSGQQTRRAHMIHSLSCQTQNLLLFIYAYILHICVQPYP